MLNYRTFICAASSAIMVLLELLVQRTNTCKMKKKTMKGRLSIQMKMHSASTPDSFEYIYVIRGKQISTDSYFLMASTGSMAAA